MHNRLADLAQHHHSTTARVCTFRAAYQSQRRVGVHAGLAAVLLTLQDYQSQLKVSELDE